MDIFDKIIKNLSGSKNSKVVISENIKTKKRKKKKIKKKQKTEEIETRDGIILKTDPIKYINYKDMRATNRFNIKENLLEWSSRDFVLYTKNLYYQKYNKDCGLQIPVACKVIKELRSDMEEIFVSCNNILIKNYIDFFFDNYLDNIIVRGTDFYFSQLKNYDIITSFYNNYGERREEGKSKSKVKNILDNSVMESLYLLDTESFVYKYGIILSINWLIFKHNLSVKEAKNRINKICKKAYQKKLFNIIEKSTEEFSPYPDWFKVKNIGSKVKVTIEFNNLEKTEKKYSFLRRG